jgi:hypothetical protein
MGREKATLTFFVYVFPWQSLGWAATDIVAPSGRPVVLWGTDMLWKGRYMRIKIEA